jgi:hypothetical protein
MLQIIWPFHARPVSSWANLPRCQLASEEADRAAARLLTQGEAGVNDYSINSKSLNTRVFKQRQICRNAT